MQMSTLKGWHGGHLEEAPKEELRRLIQKGSYCSRMSFTYDAHIFLPPSVCSLNEHHTLGYEVDFLNNIVAKCHLNS